MSGYRYAHDMIVQLVSLTCMFALLDDVMMRLCSTEEKRFHHSTHLEIRVFVTSLNLNKLFTTFACVLSVIFRPALESVVGWG